VSTWGAPFTQAQILQLMKTEFARGACILMQVDRLQALADIHGVELKESVRAAFGRLVAEGTRGADQLGLIPGDRYLLVLPHTSEEQALTVADRLRRYFGNLEVKSRGSILAMSLSLGVVSCEGQDTLFFDTMLTRAEAALGWAQEAGGDRVEVFRREDLDT
jgi:diguanylate cyclase (GGDEF)-like protein